MDAKQRRQAILKRLNMNGQPVTGTLLAKELGVSRQVIVGDIAILRAAGTPIYATPEGYIAQPPVERPEPSAVFACRHDYGGLGKELEIIIDHGGKVLDVIVEHPLYGEIKANLMLSSRRQLADFLQKLADSGAQPLSIVTGGIHLHTVTAPSTEILEQIRTELKINGFLVGD